MSGATRILVAVFVFVSLMMSLATAAYVRNGTATFYTAPYVPSSCHGYKDDGVMIAAASDAIWGFGAACGRYYKVKCTGAGNWGPHPCKDSDGVVVRIVDYCAHCHGVLDLSEEAFAAIAEGDAGKIKIEFKRLKTMSSDVIRYM